MKVAISSGISRKAGGLFYAVSALCKSLQNDGISISVFGAEQGFGEDDRNHWVPVKVKPYSTFGPLKSSLQFRRQLSAENVDLVHQHGIWLDDQWATLQWQKKTDKPVVISSHGMLDPWAVENSAWKKKLVGRLFADESLRQANCIHALCRSELDSIRAYGLANPVAIIPNGVELPDIEPRNGENSGEKTLLFLGRLHPKKGIHELLQAWSGFSSDWKLLIAGWDDGGHEQALRMQINSLGLQGRAEIVGPKFGTQKEQLLRSVDAFVLPSFSEGLPMSVLEAWSFRLPVVMTDFCNLPEGFAVDAAIRVEPHADSILSGLEKLAVLSTKELETMGANGRRLVEEKFTWPRISKEMAKVYEWCLTGENPPACMEF